jgi:hypothetical protein
MTLLAAAPITRRLQMHVKSTESSLSFEGELKQAQQFEYDEDMATA